MNNGPWWEKLAAIGLVLALLLFVLLVIDFGRALGWW